MPFYGLADALRRASKTYQQDAGHTFRPDRQQMGGRLHGRMEKRGRQKPIPVGEVTFHEFAETDKGFVYSGSERLILLDYDGTLVGFQKRPEDAVPTPEVIQVLKDLTSDPANHVVINSGRDIRH